jgi:hypothetical protein
VGDIEKDRNGKMVAVLYLRDTRERGDSAGEGNMVLPLPEEQSLVMLLHLEVGGRCGRV